MRPDNVAAAPSFALDKFHRERDDDGIDAPGKESRVKNLSPRLWLVLAIGYGLALVAAIPSVIPTLGLNSLNRWFIDSFAILAANDAIRLGLNPWDANPLDIIGRAHVYSEWWFGLRHLGLTRDHNFLFGAVSIGLFLIVALAGLRPRTVKEALLIAAVILSPPFLLAFNRANNDLLVFALLGAGLLGLRSSNATWRWCVVVVTIALGTGLKYYPIVAVAALGLIIRPTRRMILITGGASVAALGCFVLVAHAAPRGMLDLPASVYLFGATELLRGLGLTNGGKTVVATFILGVSGCALAFGGVTRGLADETRGSIQERAMFAVGALLLSGCFVAGSSYAYRWIFSLWLWPWLWRESQQHAGGKLPRLALALLGISLWADGIFCLVVNLSGRWQWEQVTQAINFWSYVTQPLVWLLMGLLAGWLVDALRATVCTLREDFRPVSTPPASADRSATAASQPG
ncbi:MAG: hypothetical protein Q7S40_19040 [Opitutaceae bacterium]|nr:hypothetical protein [Opitutaceae bacterium]